MKRKTNISVRNNVGVKIIPNMIVGETSTTYSSGDILDANAVQEKIDEVIGLAPSTLDTLAELAEEVQKKQDTLVSGTNIKTIDNNSIVGSGNLSLNYISQPTTTGSAGQVLQLDANGQPDWVTPSAGTTPDSEMSDSSTNAVQNKVIKDYIDDGIEDAQSTLQSLIETKAPLNGEAPLLTAGKADNITGESIPVTTGYTTKPTGYNTSQPELEFADGLVKMTEMRGRVAAWNQLVQNGDFRDGVTGWSVAAANFGTLSASDGILSYAVEGTTGAGWQKGVKTDITCVSGHMYLFVALIKTETAYSDIRFSTNNGSTGYSSTIANQWSIVKGLATFNGGDSFFNMFSSSGFISGETVKLKYVYVIDLTLLNPTLAAKADLTVAEVEEYLASIRTPKPYYAQNAGTLLGARLMGWQLPKTANLLNPTTKQAKLVEYAYTDHDNEYTVSGLPSDAAIKFIENKVGDNLPEVTNLVTNGDFSNGTTGWSGGSGTLTASNGVLTFTKTSSGNSFFRQENCTATINHKVFICLLVKSSINVNINVGFYAENDSSYFTSLTANTLKVSKGIVSITSNGASGYLRCYFGDVANGSKLEVQNFRAYDLTAVFGEGNEPTTVAEAEAALFGIVTPDANNRFVIPSQGVASIINAGSMQPYSGDLTSTAIVMTWDGSKDDEIVAFEEDNVEVDSANIYYDNNGVKTQVFENGVMKSTGDDSDAVYDRVYFDEVAKKWKSEHSVGDVDLGTLPWGIREVNGTQFLASGFPDAKATTNKGGAICSKYILDHQTPNAMKNKSFNISWWTSNQAINILDSSYTDAASFKAAMQGVLLFYELKTPITHDTLYYKVGNEYVPMEQVFPDGINGLCCNWATETLVEQEDDANSQPQSITPVTTEVFQSDYKELLKTIGDAYVSKEQAKDSFDNFLTVLNTNSGTVLGGTYATDGFDTDGTVKFTFTADELTPGE